MKCTGHPSRVCAANTHSRSIRLDEGAYRTHHHGPPRIPAGTRMPAPSRHPAPTHGSPAHRWRPTPDACLPSRPPPAPAVLQSSASAPRRTHLHPSNTSIARTPTCTCKHRVGAAAAGAPRLSPRKPHTPTPSHSVTLNKTPKPDSPNAQHLPPPRSPFPSARGRNAAASIWCACSRRWAGR
ncbi:hypothetical protein B0H16DRAFT_519030 [Mycena metata]|uniref:Uncharacterized protein n=1 Tax=Mycena metata TaxID=1033252 RepID=A0AAD7JDN5_9AGAR|nr:hypothetical protein B0H16DRAFT_519030 [Mycena metata]